MKIFFGLFVMTMIAACSGNPAGNGKADSTATASDTITNVTNPGIGTAADDTMRRP